MHVLKWNSICLKIFIFPKSKNKTYCLQVHVFFPIINHRFKKPKITHCEKPHSLG